MRVDGDDYTWLGAPNVSNVVPPVVNQTAFSYTSTRSVFELNIAGSVDMTVTFLSAVFPTDFQRQSFPISFMDVQVASSDGNPHNVTVYTDISAGKQGSLTFLRHRGTLFAKVQGTCISSF